MPVSLIISWSDGIMVTNGVAWEGKNPSEYIYFEGFGGGYDFIETMGMKMADGRSFSKNFGDESNKIIVNEEAARIMGLKNPVGKNITLYRPARTNYRCSKRFSF